VVLGILGAVALLVLFVIQSKDYDDWDWYTDNDTRFCYDARIDTLCTQIEDLCSERAFYQNLATDEQVASYEVGKLNLAGLSIDARRDTIVSRFDQCIDKARRQEELNLGLTELTLHNFPERHHKLRYMYRNCFLINAHWWAYPLAAAAGYCAANIAFGVVFLAGFLVFLTGRLFRWAFRGYFPRE